MPQISVIVPVYKVEPYLRRCVDSILAQTFADFELILVDDGSPDNCGVICDEYAAQDSRVHVIHQKNGGLSAARNAGIDWAFANSGSQWLTFIDSDDWVHLEYLEILLRNAEEHDVPFSACMLQEVHCEDALPEFKLSEAICLDAETAYVEHHYTMISATIKLYRKSLFNDLRFPVGKLNEDAFISHRLLFACKRVVIVPCVLYYYYQSPDSIMRSEWKPKNLDEIEAHEMHLEYLLENGYQKALDKEKCIYIWRLREQIERIQLSSWKNSMYERLLKKKLRVALFRCRKNVRFSENKWVYEFAYPTLMNTYWRLCSAKNKLLKALGRK